MSRPEDERRDPEREEENQGVLVAPDEREDEVRKQLARAFLRPVTELNVRYLPYGELERNKEAMARFGTGVKIIDAIAKKL